MLIYLDSSMIIKRYVQEEGTKLADFLYDYANDGHLRLAFNLVNIGEVLGVFDTYRRRGWIEEKVFGILLRKFINETLHLLRIEKLVILPSSSVLQMRGWKLVLTNRLYIIDALQITSFFEINGNLFVSGDKQLVEVAKEQKIPAYGFEDQEKLIADVKERIGV